jgi:hypothetical protein
MTASSLLAGLVLEDGRRWGQVATTWQRADATAILDPGEGDPRYHFLTRPRGGSKTVDLAGVTLAALVDQFPRGRRGYGFAADKDQAGLLLDSVAGFVDRTSEIRGAVSIQASKLVANRSGATFEIMASDASSAWGLRPYLAVIDEIAQWSETRGPRSVWTAIFSAMPKVPDGRLALLSTAGDPAHFAHRILADAKGSSMWRVSEVPGPTPWLSERALEEQRRTLPEWAYRRLHLNEWAAADDRISDPEDLAACVVLDGPLASEERWRYLLTLDIGVKNDRTVLAVTHVESEGGRWRMVLDRMTVWTPSRGNPVSLDEVEAAAEVAARGYRAELLFDWHQAAQLTQRLQSRGIRCREFVFNPTNISRAALALHELIRTRRLAIPNDADLLEELGNVRLLQTSPGVYRIDHDPSRHDDRAIALAMAAHTWGVDPPTPAVVSEVPEEEREMADPYAMERESRMAGLLWH